MVSPDSPDLDRISEKFVKVHIKLLWMRMRKTRYLLDTLQIQESVLTCRYRNALGMTPPILVLDFLSRGPQGQGHSATDQFYRLGTIFQSVTWFWNGTHMQTEFYPPAKCHRIFLSGSAVGWESGCLIPRRSCHTVSQSQNLLPNVHLVPCDHPLNLTTVYMISR
jgi:hypothetical protein